MNKPTDSSGGKEDFAAFDLAELWHLGRRHVWFFAACALAGLLAAGAYAFLTPSIYEAKTIVQVDEENPDVVAIRQVTKEDFRQPEDLKTVEERLGTESLIWRVIVANQLDQRPGYFKAGLWQRLRGAPLMRSDMIASVAGSCKAKLRRGTRLIDIAVRHSDPQMAQTLARSLVDEYARETMESLANPSRQANRFLVDEADRLKKKLESSETSLQEYREKNRAVSLEEKQNIVVERLKDLNLRVAKAENDRIALESDLAQVEKAGQQPGKLLAIGSIANSLSVLDAQRVVTAKEAAFAVLRERYGVEHPSYVQAGGELRLLRETLDKAVLNAANSLRATHEAARFAEETSRKILSEQEALALTLNRQTVEYQVLARDVESDRALFESVIKRLKETSVVQGIDQANLRVVQAPMVPDHPEVRKKALLAGVAVALGFLFGIGTVLARHVRRPTFLSLPSAERALEIPGLGTIPRRRGLDLKKLVQDPTTREWSAGIFQYLTTSIQSLRDEQESVSILFTSAGASEGKTLCAVSYAIMLAGRGVRTLLIDANFRRPRLAALFELPRGAKGLRAALENQSNLDSIIVSSKFENLSLLCVEEAAADPSRFFATPAFRTLLQQAARQYQQVVIDGAPVHQGSETLPVAKEVQSVCLVLAESQTPVQAALAANEWLARIGRSPLGFIFNRAPQLRSVIAE